MTAVQPQPRRFRKKPVVVEAMQFTPENGAAVWEWADSKPMYDPSGNVCGLRIYTLEGDMRADFGDWIIRGVKGEFYPCKPDIFAETYELVSDAVQPQADIDLGPLGKLAEKAKQQHTEAGSPWAASYAWDVPRLIATVKRLTAERDRARASRIALEQELALKDETLAELRELHAMTPTYCFRCDEVKPCRTLRILDALAARIDAHLFPTDEEGASDE